MSGSPQDDVLQNSEHLEVSSAKSGDELDPGRSAMDNSERVSRTTTPSPSSDAARQRMRATRQRGTKPETALCQALDQLGLKYEVHKSVLPGIKSRTDLVFHKPRVAVYVDGCFWHGCPIHGTLPKANRKWWQAKLEANKQRDIRTNETLAAAGWLVVRFWEHVDPVEAAQQLVEIIRDRQENEPDL